MKMRKIFFNLIAIIFCNFHQNEPFCFSFLLLVALFPFNTSKSIMFSCFFSLCFHAKKITQKKFKIIKFQPTTPTFAVSWRIVFSFNVLFNNNGNLMQIIELAANKRKNNWKKNEPTIRGKVHSYNSMQFSIDIRALKSCFLCYFYNSKNNP